MDISLEAAEIELRRGRSSARLWPCRALTIAALLAWPLAAWVRIPPVSLAGALPLAFWLPGAAFLRATRLGGGRMTAADACISTALSAAATVFIAVALALATKHSPRVWIAGLLTGLTVVACIAAELKQRSTNSRAEVRIAEATAWPARWITVTSVACCALVVLAGFLTWKLRQTVPQGGAFTVLSVDAKGAHTEIAVTSHQIRTQRYVLLISRRGDEVARRAFTLRSGASYLLELPLLQTRKDAHNVVVRLLTEPGNQTYRTLYL
jgi:hypothetical protein